MTEPTIDRPPAPKGSVYLQDVLDVVRTYAVQYRWCITAELTLAEELNVPCAALLRPSFWRGDAYCCWECNGKRTYAEWMEYVHENPEMLVRFVLLDPLRTIEVDELRTIVQKLSAEWEAISKRDLFEQLTNCFVQVGV